MTRDEKDVGESKLVRFGGCARTKRDIGRKEAREWNTCSCLSGGAASRASYGAFFFFYALLSFSFFALPLILFDETGSLSTTFICVENVSFAKLRLAKNFDRHDSNQRTKIIPRCWKRTFCKIFFYWKHPAYDGISIFSICLWTGQSVSTWFQERQLIHVALNCVRLYANI